MLDIDLWVGDYALDNTHPVRGRGRRFRGRSPSARVPLDDHADAIRGVLWYHTDQAYKQAVEQLTRVQTNVQVAVEEEDPSDDFSREQTEQAVEMLRELTLDRAVWEKKIRTYTR